MMRSLGLVVCAASLLAGACGGPAVVADSRGPFDTVSGLYGGNEFSPLSVEGKRTFAGDAPDKNAAPAPARAPALAPAPAASPTVASAPAPAAMRAPAPGSADAATPAVSTQIAPTPAAATPAAAPSAPLLVAAATAPMAGVSAAPAITPIAIDPNAFGAIFPTGTSAVKPTGEQLMQLDNLALIAAEPLRTDLQRKILACRRAGDACRLGPR